MILLTTLNARYIHAAFGLRYLRANLRELRDQCEIVEFDIQQRPIEIVERLLARRPRIIGIGIYIWNVRESLEVVSLLKRIAPEVCIVLGGPEVSHESEGQPIVALADYVITGEADLAFADLCRQWLAGTPPASRLIHAPLPPLEDVALPYDEYTEDDIAHRILYVEASRGCPFTCEFCLSSLDAPVRQFALEPFLESLAGMLKRGVRQFKFVDRTFNLNLKISGAILQFFLDRLEPGLFVHFEMVPDRLPEALRDLIVQFPPGALQFEVGIQTFNPEVAALISRRQNYERLADNLTFLREKTGVHVHADLIFGLPGETLESFGAGFDRLVRIGPQEIQVGMLKRLRGTPIIRHDAEWGMVYADHPPYEILRTRLVDFETMQRMRRFARFWDLVGNSGNFPRTVVALWETAASPFHEFLAFSDWIHATLRRTHAIPLHTLAELLRRYLHEVRGESLERADALLREDYAAAGRTELPAWLRAEGERNRSAPRQTSAPLPKRQARHTASSA
ncbi:MAG TPA: DUF4080 domain-containing protein [Chthoniobacterales bacterium]|jgi:radical SAM superfamily enzyme YgiQ (UPF0313 family)